MNQAMEGLRNVLRTMQDRPSTPPARESLDDPKRLARLAAHEKRIHDHPCPCGSGQRYGACCIGRVNQEHLELKRRRELARQGMTSCEACGREFRPGHDLTCPHCGYDCGPSELPRTEVSMRQIERRRDREMRRQRREEA
jgi:hypothetical protein